MAQATIHESRYQLLGKRRILASVSQPSALREIWRYRHLQENKMMCFPTNTTWALKVLVNDTKDTACPSFVSRTTAAEASRRRG